MRAILKKWIMLKFFYVILMIAILSSCNFQTELFPAISPTPKVLSGEIADKISGSLQPENALYENTLQADASFLFENFALSFTKPVYVINCRYYLPLAEFVTALEGTIEMTQNEITIKTESAERLIDLENNCYKAGDTTNRLYGYIYRIDDTVFVSLIDIVRMFDLKTDWNTDNSTVSIFYSRYSSERLQKSGDGMDALLRLEDFAACEHYRHSVQGLEKIRAVADYLDGQSIPFYVAWVPRYKDPENGIDMDPLTNFSMYNICFIYTLDYLVWHGGYMGLHGYTHQHDTEQSLSGNEFGSSVNEEEEQIRNICEMAINTANQLNIPFTFFEFPHYAATKKQIEIVEEYFDCIYQPNPATYSKKAFIIKRGGRNIKYVPTPLGYINSIGETDNMLRNVDNLDPETLASLFFHPTLEYEYIKLGKEEDGYPTYEYDQNSVLHRVV